MAKGEKTKLLWNDPVYRQHMRDVHAGKNPVNLCALIEYNKTIKGIENRIKSLRGRRVWNTGLKLPQFSGEKSPHWKKDRSTLSKKQERSDCSYKDWRASVWKRDNFKCRIANKDCKGRIEAHHILSWKDYSELRYKVNNGITLCHHHHPRKRDEEKKLSPYFQEIINNTN